MVGKANLVTDDATYLDTKFLSNAICHASGRDSARLGVTNLPINSTTHVEQNLGQLSCLTTSGFTGDDDDLVTLNRCADLVTNS